MPQMKTFPPTHSDRLPVQDFLISRDRVWIHSALFLGIGAFFGWLAYWVAFEAPDVSTGEKAGGLLIAAGALSAIYVGIRSLRTPRLQLRLTSTGIEYKKIWGNYANYKTNVGVDFYWIRQFRLMPYDAIADVAVEKRGWQCLICVTDKAQQKKYIPVSVNYCREVVEMVEAIRARLGEEG